jgi:hypothetical protein
MRTILWSLALLVPLSLIVGCGSSAGTPSPGAAKPAAGGPKDGKGALNKPYVY